MGRPLITFFPNTTTGIVALMASTARLHAGATTARLNPTLSEADGLAVVRAFGIELPGIQLARQMARQQFFCRLSMAKRSGRWKPWSTRPLLVSTGHYSTRRRP